MLLEVMEGVTLRGAPVGATCMEDYITVCIRVSYRIFWGGGEKKITQGYSCQHLIKSLTPSNAHCD